MRIGFVIDDSLDRPDGVQQYVLGLGKQLETMGHKVFYLAGETSRKDIKNIYSLSRNLRVRFNGNVVGTPLPAKKEIIKKILNSLNLDVLHVQLPYSPVLAGRVIKAVSPRTAIIGTLHIYPKSTFENSLNKLLQMINFKTLKRFDKIIAVSKVAADSHAVGSTYNIQVVPNHVDVTKFKKAKTNVSSSKTIVFLGRLVTRKGCQHLLNAIALLKSEGRLAKNVRVYIAGDGPLRPALENFVSKNGLSKTISFTGLLPENNKPAFLGQADIAVFPSTGGESFGIVLLEAMASGAVVLAGNNPGYSAVLSNNKNQLFEPQNINELADKLEVLLASKLQRQNIINSQNLLVKNYDIKLVAKKIEAIYKDILHKSLGV